MMLHCQLADNFYTNKFGLCRSWSAWKPNQTTPTSLPFDTKACDKWISTLIHNLENNDCWGLNQWSGRFLGITGWDSVCITGCKSSRLHVHILQFPFIKLGLYSTTSSKMIVNFPAVLNFNRFICNQLPVHSPQYDHRSKQPPSQVDFPENINKNLYHGTPPTNSNKTPGGGIEFIATF